MHPNYLKVFIFSCFMLSFVTAHSKVANRVEIESKERIFSFENIEVRFTLQDIDNEPILKDTILNFKVNGKEQEISFTNGYANLDISHHESNIIIEHNSDITKFNYTRIPGLLSILPPLIAIVLALVFKEVISALFIGLISGLIVINGFSFKGIIGSFDQLITVYLIQALNDYQRLSIIVFSMLIGAMVAIISENGGMEGLVNKLKKYASSRRKTMIITWLLGLCVFFDDYANTLFVGKTMQGLFDKFKISREKLAYIVDSTAAPVASIAFVTTWIGTELQYIDNALAFTDLQYSSYSVFLSSLQYSFYPFFTLLFMFFLLSSQRDFGPMLIAERKRIRESEILSKSNSAVTGNIWLSVLPVLVLLIVALGGIFYTGMQNVPMSEKSGFLRISELVGASDPFKALLWASLASLLVAAISSITSSYKLNFISKHTLKGFESMLPAMVILTLAWTLSDLTQVMGTATYLSQLVSENINPLLLPSIGFALAALIAFSTGSSWGTMAILFPILLPTAYVAAELSGLPSGKVETIFFQCAAVVLSGAVWGDHCSPISDTTIMSSMASGCDHISHVNTQLPYALTSGILALILGHLLQPLLHIHPIFIFIAGGLILWTITRYIGKQIH